MSSIPVAVGRGPSAALKADWPTLLIDGLTMTAWVLAGWLTERMIGAPHPGWLALPVAAELGLLAALLGLRSLGRPPFQRGLGAMSLRLFVGIWALLLPFMTAAWMTAVAGVSGNDAPWKGESWALPLTVTIFLFSFVYPILLAKSVVLPTSSPSRWSDAKRAGRAELVNTIAVNAHLVLSATWLQQTLGERTSGRPSDRFAQLAAASLILAVPRLVLLAFRFRPMALLSLLLLIAWGIIEPWM